MNCPHAAGALTTAHAGFAPLAALITSARQDGGDTEPPKDYLVINDVPALDSIASCLVCEHPAVLWGHHRCCILDSRYI